MRSQDPHSHSHADDRLAALARREAGRLTPDFSVVRHLRVMRAVEAAGEASIRPAANTRWRPMRYTLLAAAALVALIVWPAAMNRLTPEAPQAQLPTRPPLVLGQTFPSPSVPRMVFSTERINTRVRDVVETAMVQGQWAGLDQDVRQATQYLVDQVPLRSAWQAPGSARSEPNP